MTTGGDEREFVTSERERKRVHSPLPARPVRELNSVCFAQLPQLTGVMFNSPYMSISPDEQQQREKQKDEAMDRETSRG